MKSNRGLFIVLICIGVIFLIGMIGINVRLGNKVDVLQKTVDQQDDQLSACIDHMVYVDEKLDVLTYDFIRLVEALGYEKKYYPAWEVFEKAK